jgi:hypothetical protein
VAILILAASLSFAVFRSFKEYMDQKARDEVNDRREEERVHNPYKDIGLGLYPEIEAALPRCDPRSGVYINTVYGWPSVGGIIVNELIHCVELEWLGIDRFTPTPRSSNATEEDEFY